MPERRPNIHGEIQKETPDPGKSLTGTMPWDDPPPGAYTATARLEATDHEAVCSAVAFSGPAWSQWFDELEGDPYVIGRGDERPSVRSQSLLGWLPEKGEPQLLGVTDRCR